jgi:hypothetical protein
MISSSGTVSFSKDIIIELFMLLIEAKKILNYFYKNEPNGSHI